MYMIYYSTFSESIFSERLKDKIVYVYRWKKACIWSENNVYVGFFGYNFACGRRKNNDEAIIKKVKTPYFYKGRGWGSFHKHPLEEALFFSTLHKLKSLLGQIEIKSNLEEKLIFLRRKLKKPNEKQRLDMNLKIFQDLSTPLGQI